MDGKVLHLIRVTTSSAQFLEMRYQLSHLAVCSIQLDHSSFRIRMYVYITSYVATHAIYPRLGSRRISEPKRPTASLTSVGDSKLLGKQNLQSTE